MPQELQQRFYWIWPDALVSMLVFMSGKLLFDIQIMSARGSSPELQEHSENCSPPLPSPPPTPVSHDGLVLISAEKHRCRVIREREKGERWLNLFPGFLRGCLSFRRRDIPAATSELFSSPPLFSLSALTQKAFVLKAAKCGPVNTGAGVELRDRCF